MIWASSNNNNNRKLSVLNYKEMKSGTWVVTKLAQRQPRVRTRAASLQFLCPSLHDHNIVIANASIRSTWSCPRPGQVDSCIIGGGNELESSWWSFLLSGSKILPRFLPVDFVLSHWTEPWTMVAAREAEKVSIWLFTAATTGGS